MAIVRAKLSGSTSGMGVVSVTTAAAPAALHTSTTAASTTEELHVWYVNNGASTVTLTHYHGATGATNAIVVEIPAKSGPYLVSPGLFIACGAIAYAAAGATEVYLHGFVNRLTTGV